MTMKFTLKMSAIPTHFLEVSRQESYHFLSGTNSKQEVPHNFRSYWFIFEKFHAKFKYDQCGVHIPTLLPLKQGGLMRWSRLITQPHKEIYDPNYLTSSVE